MNSFSFVARGIDAEVARQIAVWESGAEVEQHTYDFDAGTGTLTAAAREGGGGRLPLLPRARPRARRARPELVERLRARCPSCPAARIRRLEGELDHERRRCSSPAGSTGSTRRRLAQAPTRGPPQRDLEPARRRGRRPGSGRRGRAREARRGARADPADGASTRRSRSSASRASAPTRTSRRRRSPTRRRSSRSSTGSSTRIPARSPRTGAARTACSASSSVR